MQQKQIELKHLAELALGIVKEEHAASQKGDIAAADAQKRAMARVAALRYGNNDYFWINDMQPRMVMHPMKPEMNGSDLSTNKDPNGKALFVDFVNVVKKDGAGFVPNRSCPMSSALLHGVGSSAPVSISTTSMRRPGPRRSDP
jgi:methyl-accepting chemotaxis protein